MPTPNPIQVIVAYDFSPSSEEALARAVDVAARAPQHVLHVVTVLDPADRAFSVGTLHGVTYETADRVQEIVAERVKNAFAGRSTAADVQFYIHARIGKPANEILALGYEVGADLLFIGSHGKTGIERFLLGSVSERVVREARCPVMVIRPKTYPHVDLLQVEKVEHARAPHREPHCYTYSNQQVVMRPTDWPLF